jgi:hypothetical protein
MKLGTDGQQAYHILQAMVHIRSLQARNSHIL